MQVARVIVAAAGVALAASGASAQVTCGATGKDLMVVNINDVVRHISTVYSFGYVLGNPGTEMVTVNPNGDHPVVAMNLYRVQDGVMRQLGMSWAFHEFFALENGGACTCAPVGGGHLGPGCQSPTSGSSASSQVRMGRRSLVNPVTGAVGAPAPAPEDGFTVLDRRITIPLGSLNIDSIVRVEALVVGPGETGSRSNNVTTRGFAVWGSGLLLGVGPFPGQPAIQELTNHGYTLSTVDVVNDGRFILASRAFDQGGGVWRYEYALFNQNSARSARSFEVPTSAGAPATSPGFNDVDYFHEAYDATDWAFSGAGSASWSTDTFASNVNANALRWGTMYNFRFLSSAPPVNGSATVGLFAPGGAGEPESFAVAAVVPADVCPADLDGDGQVGASDLAALLGAWGGAGPADFNGDGVVNAADLAVMLGAWGGC